MNDYEASQDRSLNTLMSDLTRQASDLVRQETELARAEMSAKLTQLKAGLIGLVIGAVVMIVGLLFVLDAVVYGLAEILPPAYSPWLAALLVGLAFGVAGYLVIKKSQDGLRPEGLAPSRTLHSLQQDKNVLKEKVS